MRRRIAEKAWVQVVLVVLAAAFVYLPFLGVRPLDFSEGHRAVPGWTMLESHDFWHVKMFGLTYMRKPPGMPWAIAASSAVFGETPFAARLPSAVAAILMSVVAWWYGRRWFGAGLPTAGLAAGLAQALMPLMWQAGRTAEIEMLNCFGTQLVVLGVVDLAVPSAKCRVPSGEAKPGIWDSVMSVLLPAMGVVIAAFAKGPAGAPVLGGALVGVCIAARSARVLGRGAIWFAVGLGLCVVAIVGLKVLVANDDPDAVRQGVGDFLWSRERLWGIVTLVPLAFASALPMSLALVPALRARTGSEDTRGREPSLTVGLLMARALAWTWVCSLGILVACGVSNARYAMPAAVVLPPLAAYAVMLCRARALEVQPTRRIDCVCLFLLSKPFRWAFVLLMAGWWYIVLTGVSPTADQEAGLAAARQLGSNLAGQLWADEAIEIRPDVLLEMERVSPGLIVHWAKREMERGEFPPRGTLMLLTENEVRRMRPEQMRMPDPDLSVMRWAKVRDRYFNLYEVRRR